MNVNQQSGRAVPSNIPAAKQTDHDAVTARQGNAHRIRKAVASEAAEATATEAQLNSFFGWAHGSRKSDSHPPEK